MSPRPEIVKRLRAALGRLSTTAVQRLESDMPWYAELSAQERSWIAMIVQGGVQNFVDWYADDERVAPAAVHDVFGAAPRTFAGKMSLARTVAMVRVAVQVVEDNLVEVLGERDAAPVTAAVTRYGRELGFAIAEVYARAAEQRGAWDARLEALVVDSVMRGEADDTVASRASALGWGDAGAVVAVVGALPATDEAVDEARRIAADAGLHALSAAQGDRLVVLLGGLSDEGAPPADVLIRLFGDGPIVLGSAVPSLLDVRPSAAEALTAHRVVAGWPEAPRIVSAADLLPERALAGDASAFAELRDRISAPLQSAGSGVVETLQCYLDRGSSLEATARVLFVHVNTVRYRLRRVTDITGLDPTDSREAYTLRIALTAAALDL